MVFYTNIGNLMNLCLIEGLNLKDTMIFFDFLI